MGGDQSTNGKVRTARYDWRQNRLKLSIKEANSSIQNICRHQQRQPGTARTMPRRASSVLHPTQLVEFTRVMGERDPCFKAKRNCERECREPGCSLHWTMLADPRQTSPSQRAVAGGPKTRGTRGYAYSSAYCR